MPCSTWPRAPTGKSKADGTEGANGASGATIAFFIGTSVLATCRRLDAKWLGAVVIVKSKNHPPLPHHGPSIGVALYERQHGLMVGRAGFCSIEECANVSSMKCGLRGVATTCSARAATMCLMLLRMRSNILRTCWPIGKDNDNQSPTLFAQSAKTCGVVQHTLETQKNASRP